MDLGIKDKRVLVTGASQGIGKQIALAFAREGCRVAVIARREPELRKVIDEMGGINAGHAHKAGDLMQEGVPVALVKKLIEEGGDIDIVVHNVGGPMKTSEPLGPSEVWHKVWHFNIGIAIDINALLIPKMQERRWGRVIHVSSVAGQDLRGSAQYAASKAYLNAYSVVLGRAVAPTGVVVSALMPGAVYAERGHWDEKTYQDKEAKDNFLRKRSDFLRHHHAIGRLGTAEEIAPFALFMASEQASFAAGSLIPVNGGTM